MGTIKIRSRVGEDGVLSLRVSLGQADANAEVTVTIRPTADDQTVTHDWHEFVNQTYGSCDGLGLEEPPDLPLQSRESEA